MAAGSFDDGVGGRVIVTKLYVSGREQRFDQDRCDYNGRPSFEKVNECFVAGEVFEEFGRYCSVEYQRCFGMWVEHDCGPAVSHGW